MRSFVTKGHKCGFGTSKWGPNFTQSIVKLGNEKIYRKYEEWGQEFDDIAGEVKESGE
jgi:hypothetical protein